MDLFAQASSAQAQAALLAKIAHSLDIGLMRVIQVPALDDNGDWVMPDWMKNNPDKYPYKYEITFVNKPFCEFTGRDVSTVLNHDFHEIFGLDDSFTEFHYPYMLRWFKNPIELELDRLTTHLDKEGNRREFALRHGTTGKEIPVGVRVVPDHIFPGGSMMSLERAPLIQKCAMVYIRFKEKSQEHKTLGHLSESMMEVIENSPEMRRHFEQKYLSEFRNERTTSIDGLPASGKNSDGIREAEGGAEPGGDADTGPVESTGQDDSTTQQGYSGFNTEGLDP